MNRSALERFVLDTCSCAEINVASGVAEDDAWTDVPVLVGGLDDETLIDLGLGKVRTSWQT